MIASLSDQWKVESGWQMAWYLSSEKETRGRNFRLVTMS
jgi:hypothetical protein